MMFISIFDNFIIIKTSMGNEINCNVCHNCLHESNRRKIFTD